MRACTRKETYLVLNHDDRTKRNFKRPGAGWSGILLCAGEGMFDGRVASFDDDVWGMVAERKLRPTQANSNPKVDWDLPRGSRLVAGELLTSWSTKTVHYAMELSRASGICWCTWSAGTIASNIANFTTIMMNVFSVGMMMTRARAYGSGSSTWARTTIS